MQCIKEEELIGVSEAQKERWGKIYVKLVKNSLLSDSWVWLPVQCHAQGKGRVTFQRVVYMECTEGSSLLV